jgi:hypothetical protein
MATPIPSTRSGQVWEHRIRTECDFNHHVDYIHYNPVKHGWGMRPVDWQYSSIHRYIQQGLLMPNWGADCVINIPNTTGYEVGLERNFIQATQRTLL